MTDKYDAFSDEDMAAVGRELMRAIDTYMPDTWHPMDCPSEAVGDLCNELDEIKADLAALREENARLQRINKEICADKNTYVILNARLAEENARLMEREKDIIKAALVRMDGTTKQSFYNAIAALSTPAAERESVPEACQSSFTLTVKQLRDALEFVNPDGTDDADQMESEVTIVWREAFTSDDNEPMPAGYYALITEYPEEGLYGPLGYAAAPKEPK